jgi:microcystin-dependent protein
MKPLFIFLLLTLSITSLQGQVGFNNPNPHPKSIIDLTATDKGMLIPRLTTVQRDALALVLDPAAESLLVYDTNLQGFYFFRAGAWYSLNEWVKTAGSNNVSLTGNATIVGTVSATSISSGSITNAGSLSSGSVSTGTLNVTGFAGNALVPTGAIIMWSGTTPPSGWALCDGASGRPDLRGKFVVGYSNLDIDYSTIGNQSGEKKHTLTISEMPSHTHAFRDAYFLGESGPLEQGISGVLAIPVGKVGANNPSLFGAARYLYYRDISTNSEGLGSAQENRPPYYTLAYIIKL